MTSESYKLVLTVALFKALNHRVFTFGPQSCWRCQHNSWDRGKPLYMADQLTEKY